MSIWDFTPYCVFLCVQSLVVVDGSDRSTLNEKIGRNKGKLFKEASGVRNTRLLSSILNPQFTDPNSPLGR